MTTDHRHEAELRKLAGWRSGNGAAGFTFDALLPTLSLFAALVNAGLAWYWYGGLEGLDVATRTSARFSACVFAAALAMRCGPHGTAWMRGFVATHTIHYATLLYQAVIDVGARLHTFSIAHSAVIMAGVLVLLPLAFESRHRSGARRWSSIVAVFLVWATFAGGAGINSKRHRMALIPLIPLFAALAIHSYRLMVRRPRGKLSPGRQNERAG